jgi:methionine--tRNA ligase beta chain
MSQQAGTLTFDEFLKVKLRVAKVLEAEEHPNADKLLVLKVDLGDEQRQIVAGLKKHYAPADLVGRNIVVVTNLAPRKMRGLESQGMLLAACTENESQVVVISPADNVPPGTTVT